MIRIEQLTKSFAGKPALRGISLEVAKGEIFGLLGHNGAGKSTTFGIMLGQVYPDGGEVFINDLSVQKNKAKALARVGAIFEAPGFYDYLSGWKNLEILTSYSAPVSREQMGEVVEQVGLSGRIRDKVRTYSHGMRQRLALAQALLPTPELIMLDEPTEGLDPEGIKEIRELIQQLNQRQQLTVIFSSHLLSEVQQLCNRVAILNQGSLIFKGPWSELSVEKQRFHLELDDWSLAAPLLESHHARMIDQGLIELPDDADVADLVQALVSSGVRLRALEPKRRDLEALYLEAVHQKTPAHLPLPQ